MARHGAGGGDRFSDERPGECRERLPGLDPHPCEGNEVWNVSEGFTYTARGLQGPRVLSLGKVEPAWTRECAQTFSEG